MTQHKSLKSERERNSKTQQKDLRNNFKYPEIPEMDQLTQQKKNFTI
jgi:hypothetical protein